MSKVKIFWQETCPNCPPAKELGKRLEAASIAGVTVEYYNVKDADGLTEAVMHGVMATPSIVVVGDDGSEKAVWHATTPKIDEVKNALA